MKKLITFVITLSIAISMFAQTINAESATVCKSAGDANADDAVNLSDVTLILKHIAKWSDLTIDLNRADVTNDNNINLSDVTVVLQYIAKWDSVNLGHSYFNYQCSKCGEVDKSHAYEYLVEWVKANGEVDGAYVNFEYYDDEDCRTYSLTYSANNNYLFVNSGKFYEDDFSYGSIYLNDYSYFVSFIDHEVGGYIDASNFTDNSPITYVHYEGSDDLKWDMVELARLSINGLIYWLDWCLEEYNIGIMIQDLGFNSYVCY